MLGIVVLNYIFHHVELQQERLAYKSGRRRVKLVHHPDSVKFHSISKVCAELRGCVGMENKNFTDFKSSLKPKHIIAVGQAQSLNFYNCSVCSLRFVAGINMFRGSSEASFTIK